MGHSGETCPCCAISRQNQAKIFELQDLIAKYKAKMDEAATLLIQQNYEIHDLRDALKGKGLVSDWKH